MKKVSMILMAVVVALAGTLLSSCVQQKKDGANSATATVQKNHLENRDTVRYHGECALCKEVFFVLRKSGINRSMVKHIKEFADYANEHKDCKILIEGFANEWDVEAKTREQWRDYQFEISKKRADNVKEMLVKTYDVDANRITTKGLGWRDNIHKKDNDNRLVLLYAIKN